jgi:hypothetical protein
MADAPNYHKKLTATGLITGRKNVVLDGILIGTDAVNDPTITVFDGEDGTGVECLPTAAQPATEKGWFGVTKYNCLCTEGWFGVTKYNCLCTDGIYVVIVCAGTVEVVVLWRDAGAQR